VPTGGMIRQSLRMWKTQVVMGSTLVHGILLISNQLQQLTRNDINAVGHKKDGTFIFLW